MIKRTCHSASSRSEQELRLYHRKFWVSVFTLMLSVFIVSGCSAIEEVTESINYVEKATNYINKMSNFANEVPPLIENATTDPTSLEELETKLTEVKKEMDAFNQLTPPDFAQEVHTQILEHNQQLGTVIDAYTNSIEDGKIDPNVLQNSELIQQIEQLTKILEQVQNLGG